MKFVISKHHARGDFSKDLLLQLSRTLQSAKMRLSALGSDAIFVGYNYEAAVSNLFAEGSRFSKRLLLLYQPLIC